MKKREKANRCLELKRTKEKEIKKQEQNSSLQTWRSIWCSELKVARTPTNGSNTIAGRNEIETGCKRNIQISRGNRSARNRKSV